MGNYIIVIIIVTIIILHNYRYGDGDFLLGEILRIISEGKWDFVWAQQWFTITDQLNMGARSLMLDPVYFWEEMRLCHCGGLSVKWLNNVIEYIEKVCGRNFM